MRTCRGCNVTKDDTQFTKGKGNLCKPCSNTRQREWRKNNPDKYSQYCKSWRGKNPEKQSEASKNWQSRNPDYSKNYNLLRRYNISLEDYLWMVEEQKGLCAICDKEAQLYVDHNHVTNVVRQLLCDPCNKAIGLMKEVPETLRKAADYLEKHIGQATEKVA